MLPREFSKKLYPDYYFYNLDTAHKYSDKMSIRVLQLNQLGTKDDVEHAMQNLSLTLEQAIDIIFAIR